MRARFAECALLALSLLGNLRGQAPPPSQAPQPAVAPKFIISGIVVQHRTNQPMKHVRVTIAPNQRPDQQAALITADDGRFTFTEVPQGKYTLHAEIRGEEKTFQEDGFFSTGIVVGPGLDAEHIVFPFPAPTSLTVKVTDEEGEPVRNAQVLLFAKRITMGRSHVELASQVSTNAEGESRFAHLEPGTYYAAAVGRPWYAQEAQVVFQSNGDGAPHQVVQEGDKELDVAYPVTYYAGAQNAEAASPITLAEGDRTQLAVALRAVPAMKIAVGGVAEYAADPRRRRQPVALVEAVGPGGIRFPVQSSSFEAEGEEVISGVAPGSYIVSLSRMRDGEGRPEPTGSTHVNASGDVRLGAADLSRIAISGQVTGENGVDVNGLFVFLAHPSNGQNAFCRVAHDGSFQCRANNGYGSSIAPGVYEVRFGNTKELYPKSISVKGANYSGGVLEVRDGTTAQISIVAAKGTTELSGIALREGKAVSGAMVLLVPQDTASGSGIPRDQSDSDGTFTLPDVHPGRYLLVAIDQGHDLEYHNPRVLAPYLAGAQTVQIPLAHDAAVPVNVQHRQP